MTHFQSLDPHNGEVIATHEIYSKDAVNGAVTLANESFKSWGQLSYAKRKRILLKWKRELIAKSEEFAQLISLETGKPIGDARLEVSIAISHLAWAANKAGYYLKPQSRKTGLLLFNFEAEVQRIPFGAIGVIGPWNYPLFTPMGSIAYALAAGNTVVFKPSEFTPGVGVLLAETFQNVCEIPNVLKTVTGLGETGRYLGIS